MLIYFWWYDLGMCNLYPKAFYLLLVTAPKLGKNVVFKWVRVRTETRERCSVQMGSLEKGKWELLPNINSKHSFRLTFPICKPLLRFYLFCIKQNNPLGHAKVWKMQKLIRCATTGWSLGRTKYCPRGLNNNQKGKWFTTFSLFCI